MADIRERYRRFKEWEQQPHEVAPLLEDEHVCATCGTRFEGNYEVNPESWTQLKGSNETKL